MAQCLCHPHHIEIGGYDAGCEIHDPEARTRT